jgi:hypothetical protein
MCLLPVFSVEPAILYGLGEVFGLDLFAAAQAGDAPGDYPEAVAAADNAEYVQ